VVYFASEWKGKDLLQFVPIYNRHIFSVGNKSRLFNKLKKAEFRSCLEIKMIKIFYLFCNVEPLPMA
jgi:hypothetical protein